jgi:hypothetical protein
MDYEEALKACLEETGTDREIIMRAVGLYRSGQGNDLVRLLKAQRCGLVEEMHESQRRVDRIDYLIRQSKNK